MKRTWIVLFIAAFSLSAFSSQNASLESFNKRFIIKRSDEGAIESVKMNFFSKKFSLKPYIKRVISDLKSEIARMQSKEDYDQELEVFLDEIRLMSEKSEDLDQDIHNVRESMKNLVNVDVDQSFAGIQEHGVLSKFEFDLKDALKMLDLSIIADPTDARYFYRKTVTYEVVKRALDFAKKRFDSVPLLNLVSFVIVKVHDLVIEQRTFHQNMLLHYLQNFPEGELGMTKEEADRVFSSIYESKIGFINYQESNRAAANWDFYGTDKFFAILRGANTKLRRSGAVFEKIGTRFNFSFVEVVEDGQRVVKNLIDRKHMFSGAMPTAFYYDKPEKVKRFRSLLNLAQVGLGFLPIPGWLKGQVNNFVDSLYVQQKLTEGALVGYFESNQDFNMVEILRAQQVNPYLMF